MYFFLLVFVFLFFFTPPLAVMKHLSAFIVDGCRSPRPFVAKKKEEKRVRRTMRWPPPLPTSLFFLGLVHYSPLLLL
jgi:hypothetical protein